MPTDATTGKHRGYAFVEFKHSVSGPYAIQLLSDIPLFGKLIRVRTATRQSTPAMTPTPSTPALHRSNSVPGPSYPQPSRGGYQQYYRWQPGTPTSRDGSHHHTNPTHMSEPPQYHRRSSYDSAYSRYDSASRYPGGSEPYYRQPHQYGWQGSSSMGASPDFRHQHYQHGAPLAHQGGHY